MYILRDFLTPRTNDRDMASERTLESEFCNFGMRLVLKDSAAWKNMKDLTLPPSWVIRVAITLPVDVNKTCF